MCCVDTNSERYVYDNGLHPVTWLSCPSGKAITHFLTYIDLTNKFIPLKFCHLGWYRYFVWPLDYKSHLCDLAEQLCDRDTLALVNNINMVFKEVSADLQPLLPAAPADHDVPDEFIISVTDCEQKLSKLCVHKAMGPDNIPNWILKDFSYILSAPIAAIYNSSVRQSYVPPLWKQAEILPIPKVSQVTSLAKKHLRPIALTPVLSKVLESFVVSWMRRATVHSETQLGGIKDSSTTLALFTMLHHVLQRLKRKNTYARILLIDFSKAFDHIDHNILLDKLKTNGVPQICVEWQKAFLTSRTQRVKLANTKSDWTEVAGEVPQGLSKYDRRPTHRRRRREVRR